MKSVMTPILNDLVAGRSLDSSQAALAIRTIIAGESSDSETAAFLFGMRAKGETLEELTAIAEVMREEAVHVDVDVTGAVDVCGTGGDHSGTVNISTAVMFVVAGAGVPVLKHGNRSVSSKSGSVDVLEVMGANPLLHKAEAEQCFKETGMTFMFAPYFHPAMKHVVMVRKALKMRTFFNIMGPLLNPARVKRQVIGAYSTDAAEMMAGIVSRLGMDLAFVVHSDDGLDELTVSSKSTMIKVEADQVHDVKRFDPQLLGFEQSPLSDLVGGDAELNAAIIQALFTGKSTTGLRDVVILNSAYAIVASGKTDDTDEALSLARESLDTGKANKALHVFTECTRDLTKALEQR